MFESCRVYHRSDDRGEALRRATPFYVLVGGIGNVVGWRPFVPVRCPFIPNNLSNPSGQAKIQYPEGDLTINVQS
jgi:hypothetical protein